MRINWNALQVELLKGIYPTPDRGRFTPTLVVGLGGTGLKTLRYLKGVLGRHESNWVRLLGIDSDSGENEKLPSLTHLGEKELILLDQGAAVGALARADQGDRSESHVLQYLPRAYGSIADLHQEVRRKIAAQKGAGQLRRAGRLLFHSNVVGGANVMARFRDVYSEVRGLAAVIGQQASGLEVEQGARIYVVCSIAGGTGAGIVLDCIALLRSLFQEKQDSITVICLLPGHLLDRELHNPRQESVATRGNAMAALRELQAFDQGAMSEYVFTFNASTRIGPLPRFLDDIYLVGDHSRKNVPANSYMELTQAVAQFLYCFVGEGIGTTMAAGAINGAIDVSWRQQQIPRVFNSLGIGVIEYPVDDLAIYLVRSALGRWVKHWTRSAAGVGEVKSAVDSFLAGEPLVLKSGDTLRARLLPDIEDRRGARFLADPGLRKAFLRQNDDVFISKGFAKIGEIDSVIEGWVATMQAKADAWRSAATERLDGWVLEAVASGLQNGARHVATLIGRLDELMAKVAKERERRDDAMERLLEELRRLGPKIHFWDFNLDIGLRKKFLEKIDRYLDLKVQEKGDAFVIECLSLFRNAALSVRGELEILDGSAAVWDADNDREMEKMVAKSDRPGFVQRVVEWGDFPAWAKKFGVDVSGFRVMAIEWDSILGGALEGLKAPVLSILEDLNIVHDAKRDPALARRIGTLNVASEPMIHCKESAPAWEDMIPQKFVAGMWAASDDRFVAANFSAPPGKHQSTAVAMTNPHLIACAQTCHGFGAAHWSQFDSATLSYQTEPWLYHVVEDVEALPPLQLASLEEAETLQVFGLALMFELILVRGSNYYRNLIAPETEDVRHFLVYADGRSTPAAELKRSGLVTEPGRSQIRPRKSERLGDSLEAALAGFRHPDAARFREDLSELLADFTGHQGRQKMAEMVRAYIEGDMSRMILAATDRRDLLEKIAAGLDRYAKGLV